MTENVASLFGGPIGQREVVESAVKAAQELLEAVEAGEVVGVAIVRLHHDRLASYQLGGRIGGFALLGALETAKADLIEINSITEE